MKTLQYILGCLFVLISLAACSCKKPAVVQNETTIITKTQHDTLFKIAKDSSSLQALLDCQNGKVVVKEIVASEPGRKLKSPKVQIVDNTLRIDCSQEAQELLARYKSTHQNTQRTITNTIEVNKLTFWQQLQLWGFRLYALLTLLIAVWLYIQSKIK